MTRILTFVLGGDFIGTYYIIKRNYKAKKQAIYKLKMKICHKLGSKMKEGKKKRFVVNFARKTAKLVNGVCPQIEYIN